MAEERTLKDTVLNDAIRLRGKGTDAHMQALGLVGSTNYYAGNKYLVALEQITELQAQVTSLQSQLYAETDDGK